MDQTALLRFLMDASRRGYAAGRSAVKTREADHSTTIVLEHGDWRFHDNYFGGGAVWGGGGLFPPGPAGLDGRVLRTGRRRKRRLSLFVLTAGFARGSA